MGRAPVSPLVCAFVLTHFGFYLVGCQTAPTTPQPPTPPIVLTAPPALVVSKGNTSIEVGSADGTGMKTLGPGRMASWTYDGRIVYELNQQTWVMNADGTGAKMLYPHALVPSVSVDGKITFTSQAVDMGGNLAIWVADSLGATARQVTSSAVTTSVSAWSPDGTQLVVGSPGTELEFAL